MKWTAKERMLALTADSPADAHANLLDAGFKRTYHSVCQYRIANGVTAKRGQKRRKVRRTHHRPGAGRTRAQNRALWNLAERRPNPDEYQRERAAILRGENP